MDEGIQLFAGPAKRKKASTAATEATVKRQKHDGSTSSAAMLNKVSSIHPADASTSKRQDGDAPAAQQQSPRKKPAQQSAEATAVENNDAGGAADATAAEAGAAAPSELPQAADFKSLGLTEWLCSICASLGMQKPTQVQSGCIPAILKGKDVIGTAQTGSGKTAAFALPILQLLAKDPFGVFALVLTPTRELAVQVSRSARLLPSLAYVGLLHCLSMRRMLPVYLFIYLFYLFIYYYICPAKKPV
jgi:ATP-dependent RNA helicase DDX49/DBP8